MNKDLFKLLNTRGLEQKLCHIEDYDEHNIPVPNLEDAEENIWTEER
jgi:hypothetical protein